jgi:hypothetical protein
LTPFNLFKKEKGDITTEDGEEKGGLNVNEFNTAFAG